MDSVLPGTSSSARQNMASQDDCPSTSTKNQIIGKMTEYLYQNTIRKRKLPDLRARIGKRLKLETNFVNDQQSLSRRKRQFDNSRRHQEMPSHEGPTTLRNDVIQDARGGHQKNNSCRNDTCSSVTDRKQVISVINLISLAKANKEYIFLNLNRHKDGLMNLLNSPIHRLDDFILIFGILSKTSQSPFEELKHKFLLDVCNSDFMTHLRNYLIDLPYTENKVQNSLYWENQGGFWKNFIMFCDNIIDISPTTAVKKCRALMENISKTCLEYLNQRHGFVLPEEDMLRLDELRNKLITYADGNKSVNKSVNVGMKPPEDFRELSVVPTREDLLDSQPFLRPNIVNGGYSDVEHYLDVQFRLLREDCFGPIRVGIDQYLGDPNKRKYDHIRIYRNVKFIGPYISNLKVGQLIQIDLENNNYLKRINWARSKRCMFGSLVIFTKDRHFNDVKVASILDRDKALLSTGKLAVSVINSSCGINIHEGDTYTMIESEVYYEAYYHVLKALQEVSFPKHLAMQQYIVKVNPASAKPAYLTEDKEYFTTSKSRARIKFNVLQPASWPTKEEIRFNESQYEAYKLALTHELAVIQGPPGTGKTYVGLKVAKTLLQNIKEEKNCLMLVICYTNHALDQFLEGISKVTKNIVRIGGQSRNPAMEQFNLVTLRRNQGAHVSGVSCLFREAKGKLRKSIDDFQEALLLLDVLNFGVINCKAFEEDIPQLASLCNFYRELPSVKDPLMHWLFENKAEYSTSVDRCLRDFEAFNIDDNEDNEFDNIRMNNNIVLDEDKGKETRLTEAKRRITAFSLFDAKLALKENVLYYTNGSKKDFRDRLHAEMAIQDLSAKIKQFKDMMKYRSKEINLYVDDTTNFSRIMPQDRWRLYFMWIKDKVKQVTSQVKDFQASVSPEATVYEETRMLVDMELLRNRRTQVLGLTTSGAARMRKLLQAVSPKIVIVEEAAEVLEQHIVTSLTKDCQHLILIGDHQQLRPSASYMKLAKEYNIEVSLFERMITNGIHSRRLKVQHRMRPEIAALISPHIYPDLENHPSVKKFGDVPGLEKNLFFFSHEYPEEINPNDNTSKTNRKEADLTLALANYLIQQGCKGDTVTILATYSGQMFYMRKERNNYPHLSEVKITVVDNYQGEESKIILLSLVRNNPDNNIGFLGIKNRICVALSRAKQGLYIFGNINMLKAKSELWKKIASILENNGSLGTTLNLKCQVHPDQITPVKTAGDFVKVPEGGCARKCNYQYSCGHFCLLYCHGYDREHLQIKCTKKCERVLCDFNHICPLKCCEDCGNCQVLVTKTLPCGHDMKVFCYREPDDPRNKCLEEIEITLPICGHKVKKQCFMEVDEVKCTEKCRLRLEDCGHVCKQRCHIAFSDHSNYLCTKNCDRAKKGCQAKIDGDLGEHQCKKKCFEQCDDCNAQIEKTRTSCGHVERVACCVDIDKKMCKKKCTLKMDCGHHCKKLCYENCGGCKIMVQKGLPDCNHKITIECKKQVTREMCKEKCKRTLSCGHPCTDLCGAMCDRTRCKQLIAEEIDASCGHKVKLPCNVYDLFKNGSVGSEELLKYCKTPCNEELACSHICKGTCSQCHQGRLHMPCKQTCNQMNICGHQCQEPCNQICPPCNKPCEVQCSHSRCSRVCGRPCVPCKERCGRRCPHGACTRRCSEACSRAACGEACPRALPCGHRCRGVCGEPCPDVCRICRPEQFPTDFLGDQYGDDEKFILLQDCGHVLLMEDMDILMMGDRENIQIRQCPFCRKPIINTNRYKELVNNMFKNEINPIKERVYGKNVEIDEKKKELRNKIAAIYKKCTSAHPDLNIALRNFITYVNSQDKKFLLLVEMLIMYCNILEMIADCWTKYQQNNTVILKQEMETNVTMILDALKIDLQSKAPIKISEQQQKDIGNEIKRLNSIAQLASLRVIVNQATSNESLKTQLEAAEKAVLAVSTFDEDEAVETLTVLKKSLKSSGIITKMERTMIVKAVGLKAGHWYKCPNGHFYCIDRCGGAMEVSKCADCGVTIGGTNHALISDNAHAPEMDGSAFAAYSEAANNMANFMIDN